MTKFYILLLFAVFTLNVNAQIDKTKTEGVPRGLLGLELPIELYKGTTYEFWALANGYEDTELIGENVKIEEDKNDPFKYYVTPLEEGICKLKVVALVPSKGRSVVMRVNTYSVKEKPSVQVSLGGTRSGDFLGENSEYISCVDGWNKRLHEPFEVISWQLIIENKKIVGEGNKLSTEAKQAISKLEAKTPIVLSAICQVGGHELELTSVFLK